MARAIVYSIHSPTGSSGSRPAFGQRIGYRCRQWVSARMARVPSSKELAAALPTSRHASTVCKRAASLCIWMSLRSPCDARPSCLA
eukprot:117903-Rhodomonas_salina.1